MTRHPYLYESFILFSIGSVRTYWHPVRNGSVPYISAVSNVEFEARLFEMSIANIYSEEPFRTGCQYIWTDPSLGLLDCPCEALRKSTELSS